MHTIKNIFKHYKGKLYINTHHIYQTMTNYKKINFFFGHFGHSGGGVKCYGKT